MVRNGKGTYKQVLDEMIMKITVRMFGLNFLRTTLKEFVILMVEKAQERERCIVVTPNVDFIVKHRKDHEFYSICADADYIVADGAPLVLLSKIVGKESLPERVTGADLLPLVTTEAVKMRLRVAFIGGNKGVAEQAAKKLIITVAERNLIFSYCPPAGFEYSDYESEKIVNFINEVRPHVVFLGVGAPKQEKWINCYLNRLDCGPVLCTGAAFDFLAGAVRRSPIFLRRLGLEWLWRLAKEPRRLLARYVRDGVFWFPMAISEILKQLSQEQK